MSKTTLLCSTLMILASACSASPNRFASVPDSFDVAVNELAFEVDTHMQLLGSARSMDDVLDEVARHSVASEALTDGLRDQMSACPQAVGLHRLINGIEATERGHQSSVAGAATPAEAAQRAHALERGLGDLLFRLADGWEAAGCD
jgi:hypothetical protein